MRADDYDPEQREQGVDQPEEGSATGSGVPLAAAQDVVRRSRSEFPAPPGTRPADARSRIARQRKAAQAADLEKWARASGFLLDHETFTRKWKAQGGVSGQECDVYYDEGAGRYIKRNNTLAYEDWIQFFDSLAIHNWLFVDTAYTLLGFMSVDGALHASFLSLRSLPSEARLGRRLRDTWPASGSATRETTTTRANPS